MVARTLTAIPDSDLDQARIDRAETLLGHLAKAGFPFWFAAYVKLDGDQGWKLLLASDLMRKLPLHDAYDYFLQALDTVIEEDPELKEFSEPVGLLLPGSVLEKFGEVLAGSHNTIKPGMIRFVDRLNQPHEFYTDGIYVIGSYPHGES